MTTLEVEIALMDYFKFNQKDIVCGLTATFYGLVRFETDMLVLSTSGYATAIEIKVSKADLKRDLDKPHIQSLHPELVFDEYKNYRSMHLGSKPEEWFPKIKHFYYAVPKNLEEAALAQIPPACGLLVVYNDGRVGLAGTYKNYRKPKQISNYKWTEEERMNLLRLGTMRQYSLKKRILRLSK